MKKLLVLAASMLIVTASDAQPWGINPNRSLKLEDIVAEYQKEKAASEEYEHEEENQAGEPEENDDYHFNRWVWYWERHLDENGYLVSPVKTWNEWKAYKEKRAQASSLSKTTAADQSNWTFEGPYTTSSGYNGIGRVNIIEFHPTDSNTYWVGSSGGGAWKTADDGLTWTNMTNDLPVLGIADIDINPLNPGTIYLCTGDRDNTDNFSVGVLKSVDGGARWDTTGFQVSQTDMVQVNCLAINPQDTSSLILGTANGIFKSNDAGKTWTSVAAGNFKQVLYKPADSMIVYASSYYSYPGPVAQIYRSTNGGLTWSAVTSFSATKRITLATTPANPTMVMAVVANTPDYGLQGIYKSTNSGQSFTNIFSDNSSCSNNILNNSNNGGAGCSGQSWYDLTIAINPNNQNQVVVGAVNTWFSNTGGTSWQQATKWSGGGSGVKVVHADKHWHMYHPLKQNVLYECNDGGVYKTENPVSQLWTDLSNGLLITQFYRNAVSNNASFVIGGAQDNGSKKIASTSVFNLTGGDGMDCQMDPVDSNVYYTASQYGSLQRTVNNGANFDNIRDNIPGKPSGDWITPFVLLPSAPTNMVAGFDQVYFSPDRGDTWTSLSPVFYSGQNIKRIALSLSNTDYIYVVVNNKIHYTNDLGNTWTYLPTQYVGNISDIIVDPVDPTHIWVTSNGYNAAAKVAEFWPSNGNWKNRTEQLPNIPVNCIAIDSSNNTIYIGTDVGVYYRDTSTTTWEPFINNLPNVEITDLAINYTTNELWAATYGRGMWKSIKNTPGLSVNSNNNFPLERHVISVVPNPNNGNFELNTGNKALMGQNVHIRIVSLTGAVVWEKDTRIDAQGKVAISADLARGAYLVDVNKSGVMFARERLIVN